MVDFSQARLIAGEIKKRSAHRRQRVVNNIMTACEAIITEGGKVTAAEIETKAKELGLDGPRKQSIYNAKDDLGPLVMAYANCQAAEEPKRRAKASYSSDEEEILTALVSPRNRSMFRDIIAERDRARNELRLLDGFVNQLKKANTTVDKVRPVEPSEIEDHFLEDRAIVGRFLNVLHGYGFDLEDGEIVKSGKPTGSRDFVVLMQKKGLM